MAILAAVRNGLVLLASVYGIALPVLRHSTASARKAGRVLRHYRRMLLRCLWWMGIVVIRGHEIVAVGTNITDEAWEVYSVTGVVTQPATLYMVANPRASHKIPGDILSYRGDQPDFRVVSDGTRTTIDTSNPLPYIRETWLVQTFQDHADAICAFVNARDRNDQIMLMMYLSSKGYPRMLRKVVDEKHSKPFFEYLGRHAVKENPETFLSPAAEEPEGQRDTVFLQLIGNINNIHILGLLDIGIHHLLDLAAHYCQELHAASTASPSEPPPLPTIYTQDTAVEFHRLLWHVLTLFEKALLRMNMYTEAVPRDDEMEDFEIAINTVTACGMTLRSIAYTSFFKHHLLQLGLNFPPAYEFIIADVNLPFSTLVRWQDSDDGNSDVHSDTHTNLESNTVTDTQADTDSDTDSESDTESDIDSDTDSESDFDSDADSNFDPDDAESNFTPIPLHTVPQADRAKYICDAYAKWIRGLISHYEAANNLLQSPLANVTVDPVLSITNIGVKHPSKVKCIWKDFVKPIISPILPTEQLEWACTTIGKYFPGRDPFKPPSDELKIHATHHCEAILATMIVEGRIPDANTVIGVSKRSCPACFQLLSMLDEGFDVLGTHQTISSSSLPITTPPDVVEQMINHFTEQLQEDALRALQLDTTPLDSNSHYQKLLKRRDSMESQTMSISEGTEGRDHNISVTLAGQAWGRVQEIDEVIENIQESDEVIGNIQESNDLEVIGNM